MVNKNVILISIFCLGSRTYLQYMILYKSKKYADKKAVFQIRIQEGKKYP